MSKVINLSMKNRKMVTSFGKFEFDSNGVVDIPEDYVQSILEIPGFDPVEGIKIPDQKTTKTPAVEVSSAEVETDQEDDESTPENDLAEELDKLTVPQLKKYAKDHGVDIMGATKKDEIIPLILGNN